MYSHVGVGVGHMEFGRAVRKRFLRNVDKRDGLVHMRTEQKGRQLRQCQSCEHSEILPCSTLTCTVMATSPAPIIYGSK